MQTAELMTCPFDLYIFGKPFPASFKPRFNATIKASYVMDAQKMKRSVRKGSLRFGVLMCVSDHKWNFFNT